MLCDLVKKKKKNLNNIKYSKDQKNTGQTHINRIEIKPNDLRSGRHRCFYFSPIDGKGATP